MELVDRTFAAKLYYIGHTQMFRWGLPALVCITEILTLFYFRYKQRYTILILQNAWSSKMEVKKSMVIA
jgi:hypothetical protein